MEPEQKNRSRSERCAHAKFDIKGFWLEIRCQHNLTGWKKNINNEILFDTLTGCLRFSVMRRACVYVGGVINDNK